MLVVVAVFFALRFAALVFVLVTSFRAVRLLHAAPSVARVVKGRSATLSFRVIASLEVVQDLGLNLSISHYDAIDSHQHHCGEQLLTARRQLRSRTLYQLVFSVGIFKIQTIERSAVHRETRVDASQRLVLVHAVFKLDARSAAAISKEIVATRSDLEEIWKLFDQVVAALILADILITQLIEG